jgi:hypothetical protein
VKKARRRRRSVGADNCTCSQISHEKIYEYKTDHVAKGKIAWVRSSRSEVRTGRDEQLTASVKDGCFNSYTSSPKNPVTNMVSDAIFATCSS